MRRLVLISFTILLVISCQPSSVIKQSLSAGESGNLPTLYVVKEQVNLRAQASSSSEKIATLEDGAALQVSDNKNGWYQVKTSEGKQGWLRSDLAGPRELSLTRMASAFNDSIMPAFGGELFFDNNDLFKIIYLKLEPSFYSSKTKSEEKAKKIAEAYQAKVYPGKLVARIMDPQTDELFTRIVLPAKALANVPLPILDYGRMFSLKEHKKSVTIKVAIPDSVPDSKLLKAARRISARYDFPFIRAEIYMVSDNSAGMAYLRGRAEDQINKRVCRLYYLEDANGEDYRFHFCDR